MKKLIINADGYGFTEGVNKGIVEVFEKGLVKSTSCTPNFGHLDKAGVVARQFPEISFGIHFNLTVGNPVSDPSKIPTLLNHEGKFHGEQIVPKLLKGQINYGEMVQELKAQAAILADQGVRISHFDGHGNKHLWPRYFSACIDAAKHFNIRKIRTHNRVLYSHSGPLSWAELLSYYKSNPTRVVTHLGGRARMVHASIRGVKHAQTLITPGYFDKSMKYHSKFWYTLAKTLPKGVHEVYCHPGYPDELLRNNSQYVDQRLDEVKVLTDENLLQEFENQNVELISFHDLGKTK